jgi:hypothetical protein
MIDYLPLRLGNYPQDRGTRPRRKAKASDPSWTVLNWSVPCSMNAAIASRTKNSSFTKGVAKAARGLRSWVGV